MAENNRIKVAGYAKRVFFNDNIEYRNFSPDLVGFQLTSEGGTTLFTNGNFSIDTNLEPKPDILFKQSVKSKLYSLDDVSINETDLEIQKNVKAKLNLDLTNPLSYVWYGSSSELIKASLIEIQNNWPAAIYVDNKVGSVTGNNITNYVYDISLDRSTFNVNSRFFVNPYNVKYTLDSKYTPTDDTSNKLRNFTVEYNSYDIEYNGNSKSILSISAATQKTNSELQITVEGNIFPELTGIYIPQYTFLYNNISASLPYYIKPNQTQREKFFTELNQLQSNLLNRNIYPAYKAELIGSEVTDAGMVLTSKKILQFPVLDDGYNLNFFNSIYLSYLDKITKIGEDLDESDTDIIIRKFTTEAINSFDTLPKAGVENLNINGEKATKLLRIYGVGFDEVKRFINGIKFAHIVTYNKKGNVPDTLVKDLAYMLGIDIVNFVTDTKLSKLLLPSNGEGQYSGTSINYTQEQVDIELYRRLILNVSWLWKSKGSRKAIEFLFRFIGAPEALVNFNEYIVMVNKPLDMEEIKNLLYIYTGEVNEITLENIPYDDNGYPLPPVNGDLVITNLVGEIEEVGTTQMYFQKAGGWYRETYGSNTVTNLKGNNPHVGQYDGGNEYLNYFSRCYIPNFNSEPSVTITATSNTQNNFTNYNYGIFNGIPTGTTEFFTSQLTYNINTNKYQPIDNCLNVEYSIVETPLDNEGKTTFQQQFAVAEEQYLNYLSLIEENSYLAYSPEWETIKSNYELAQNNCLLEVSTEDCNNNNTLQICLNELEESNLEYSCENLELVKCLPFAYYVNENGDKVSFDEFETCCTKIGGRFINYINEFGREVEYCSKLAPCVGEPTGTFIGESIVVFDMANNTLPNNVYQINGKCFQYKYSKVPGGEVLSEQSFINVTGYGIVDYLELYLSGNLENTNDFNLYFNEVDCNFTTVISSPECCAYYGFDFQIVKDENGTEYIVCIKAGDQGLNVPDLVVTEQPIVPILDTTINTEYLDFQNPIGGIANYYSTSIFTDCFNESAIILGTNSDANTVITAPNQLFSGSTILNIPSNWQINNIDNYGRISFTPLDYSNNYILDWNATGQLAELYTQIAEFYGYPVGNFTFNCDNVLIPYYGNTNFQETPNAFITAAVDLNRIGCDSIDNLSVVFASEKWQGFNLPELSDCSCSVDFSFDYMLKYDAENLMECTTIDPCIPAIFNEVSLNNINCRNFVTFTENEETSELLLNNFNSGSSPEQEYVVWQNNRCIVEPDKDCCSAIGGNITSLSNWEVSNEDNLNNINNTYESIKSQIYDGSVSELLNGSILSYENTLNEVNLLVDSLNPTLSTSNNCFSLNLDSTENCQINYGEYINTQNLCSLDIPLECGLWTKTATDYKILINGIKNIIEEYSVLCDENIDVDVNGGNTTSSPDNTVDDTSSNDTNKSGFVVSDENQQKNAIIDENNLIIEKNGELTTLNGERDLLTIKMSDINNEINSKISDNLIIDKATTEISLELDCTVYQDKLNDLDRYDYKTFCNIQVYGNSTPNTLDKITQYNECVSKQTLINQEEKLIYTDLLENCQLYNTLNTQLTQARFENNSNLINELERQIFEVEVRINVLTIEGKNFLSSDETLRQSELEKNDNINTINKTAELLNTTTENITDSNGNISLTDKQKIDLGLQSLKNESQISSLEIDKSEINALIKENLSKQKEVNKGFGSTLLSWGAGLIGISLFLKGYLDPETTGVVLGGIGAGGAIKDDPLSYGCNIPNGTTYSNIDGYTYQIINLTPAPNVILCNSVDFNNGTWLPIGSNGNQVVYENGQCCQAYRINTTTGEGSGDNSVPVEIVTDQEVLNPSGNCPSPNDLGFSSSANPIGQILYNGIPLREGCCESSVTGFEVDWNSQIEGCFPALTNDNTNDNTNEDTNENTLPPVETLCCDTNFITTLNTILSTLESQLLNIESKTQECYDDWLNTLNTNYQNYIDLSPQNYLKYIDDLKINFKLFVNNTNIDTNTNVDSDLTYLPYTQSINPIWEWDPTQDYSGIVISGSEINIATIEDAIFNSLASQNIDFSPDLFEPNWQTLNFTIPECVCDDLRRLYPNREFFFSIEIENYECSLCLLVDNISVNVKDCKTNRLLSLNNCIIPELSCVVDNKKSWVYYEDGVKTETINPDGECNTQSSNISTVNRLTTPQERLWDNLEYRYTDYDVNHSDLIINVKNTSFSIDPAKAIECDVYDFWKQINCDECPTSCTTADTITFSGQVYTSTTLGDYTLDVSASTNGLSFSCDTYTSILSDQVLELKNDYYTLTTEYNQSLNASYNDLLNKGGSLSKFYIQKNNCGSDTIVINNDKFLENLFGLLTEDSNGTLSFYETYIYSGTTPYVGGTLTEVLSGITAQTFNQTSGLTSECCSSFNNLINSNGVNGLNVGKNYVWDTTTNSCNWKEINDCQGDCDYYGTKKVISREDCLSGITTGTTVGVCVSPLDYLDYNPSQINVKNNFDTMVLSNLIDVKSRQTISNYPMLKLFYQLYLTASNCGSDLTGRFTYDTMFNFMDKIGDYWLDLLEQAVPATTIWEGCDNSGKIYRNTIFDQNKYEYKKYSLNFIEVESDCSLSAQTDFSIGSETTYTVVEQKPIYPSSPEISSVKKNILDTKVLISQSQNKIKSLNSKLCSLNLQDVDTPNLQNEINFVNNQISGSTEYLITEQTNLNVLLTNLEQLQQEYLKQESNYYDKYTSCSGLTVSLVNAQNNLINFVPGTTAYERQRDFIATLKSKVNKCVRKSNLLVSNYNTVFITQIYDTNEYEGNITIGFDPDWEEGGDFYNKELIHNC